MAAQQRQGRVRVGRRDNAAEATAHVEDLVHLLLGDPAALPDQLDRPVEVLCLGHADHPLVALQA